MNNEIPERQMLVMLPESVVGALLQMNASFDAGWADSLRRSMARSAKEPTRRDQRPNAAVKSIPKADKYSAEFLGVGLGASTLPGIFAQFVDLVAEVAPEALDRLAAACPRKRRFVAHSREAIHPGRRDLAVMRTSSGWWISKNIGQADLERALQALAEAAGLRFGADIKFQSAAGS